MLHADVRHVLHRRRKAAVAAAVHVTAVVAASCSCDCCCCANVDACGHYCCVSCPLYQRHKETSALLLLSPLRETSAATSILGLMCIFIIARKKNAVGGACASHASACKDALR